MILHFRPFLWYDDKKEDEDEEEEPTQSMRRHQRSVDICDSLQMAEHGLDSA